MQPGIVERIQSTFDRLWLQIRIVLALSETEFALRAEKGAFGVWGVLFEPLALMMTLLGLRILIRLKSTDLLNPVIWLACGVALLYMFRKIGIKALTGVSKRQKFFFYRRIRPLDTLLASALIEARIHGTVLFIIFIPCSNFKQVLSKVLGQTYTGIVTTRQHEAMQQVPDGQDVASFKFGRCAAYSRSIF